MGAGRPRTTSFSPEQMIDLGKEMVEWIKINKPLHIKQWYSIEKMITYSEWKSMICCEEFSPYYEQAINLVSLQYIDKTSNIRDSIAHRFMRVYYKEVKEQEDEDVVFNAQMSKQQDTQGTEEQNRKLDQLLDVMRSNQRDLNSADNNKSPA